MKIQMFEQMKRQDNALYMPKNFIGNIIFHKSILYMQNTKDKQMSIEMDKVHIITFIQ